MVGPLLVPYINSNFGTWKMTFYLCIISYVFVFVYFYVHTTRFFLLLGHLCMQKAGRERSRCFWTDIPCFSFRNRVALYTARRFVISFTFYKFTTHDLINITLLYFITPFYNCLLVSLHLYYSNSHSLHHFIYNNYNF